MADEHYVTPICEKEMTCWGCGLQLSFPSYEPIFKCSWCGAITNLSKEKLDNKYYKWRRVLDRFFVSVLLSFMLFMICGGVWAVCPVVFSISFMCGAFHSFITIILSTTTLLSFGLAAFCDAGSPPNVIWGSYPVVSEGDLVDYTFCDYCTKPKSPLTHHCRSCGMCILDMDHHCPFIGNCVGAANHRSFVLFLVSSLISVTYVSIMTVYAACHMSKPLLYTPPGPLSQSSNATFSGMVKEIAFTILGSTLFLSTKGIVLVYLFIISIPMAIGLSALLWQQLYYIYSGKTYLGHLTSTAEGKRDCWNLPQFFGLSQFVSKYFVDIRNDKKTHKR